MKKPKSYALALTDDDAKKQRALRRAIYNLKGPMTLDAVREALSMTYDDLALAIDAIDRGYAWRLSKFRVEPGWGYAQHIQKVTKNVVPAALVMGPQ